MKNKKFLSVLLCLALLASLPVLPGGAAAADGSADNGMKISKTATANNDGTYTITLEAFATGEKTTTVQTEDVPTDIILVLDQSGSMKENIGQVQYTAYTGNDTQNKSNYEKRHNGGSANLWHKLPDGSFVSVSVTLQQTITYNKITKGRNDNDSKGYTNYWENRNNLYTYVNGEIKKVVYTRERDWFGENYNCKYALEDGTILNQNNEGSRYSPTFQNTDDGYLYLAVVDENQNVYTYTYTDTTGTVQTIGTSTGPNTRFEPAFYRRSTDTSGGGSRLNALKNAANAFASAVAAKAAGADGDINTLADNVNHRIAVVGFACGKYYGYTDYNYENTEVFVGSKQYKYGTAAQGQYGNAFQNMNTSTGVSNISASIGALAADGGTLTNLGLEMANGIFSENSIPAGEKRNRVVIVFTDGVPGWSGYESNIANSAITQARTAKNTYGATVYSIGIFSGADATSAGNQSGSETEKANWFMQQVSSNNGTPRYPSYYLSAGDSGSLSSIFQQISNNITTGGSSTTLGSETVVKDIISPYFTLPAGTTASDIRINTYDCTGKNGNTYTWSSTSGGDGGASATVNGDQVSVTGFNFSENWCGTETSAQGTTTVRGKKLVISFTVDPKNGFLGGNDVITNASAGIYENGSAQTPVMTFEQPTVNVPIQDVTVTAEDKNVYLLGNLTADQLKDKAVVKVGDVTLDLNKATDADKPYGLEKWQTEYVDITVEVKDAAGNVVTGSIADLAGDTTYTITATVTPREKTPTSTQGETATEQTGTDTRNINVFKPELIFGDNTVDYKSSLVRYDYEKNDFVDEQWKHGETVADPVTMIGEKPTLTKTYAPTAGVDNNIVTATDYVPVKVTVRLNDANGTDVTNKTTFVHKCDVKPESKCEWAQVGSVNGNPAFLLHVIKVVGDLTITKNGLNVGTYAGTEDQESAIFTVSDGKGNTWTVAINGNNSVTLTGLKVGNYTVTELTDWTWRYRASTLTSSDSSDGFSTGTGNNTITVKVNGGATTTVICTNSNHNDKWLGGDNYAKNEFGSGN